MDEEDITEIYYLILLKQHGYATEEDLKKLRSKILSLFADVAPELERWCAEHALLGYDKFYEAWEEYACSVFGKSPQDVFLENVLFYVTVEHILYEGLKYLYRLYKEEFPYKDIAKDILKRYKKIKEILSFSEEYSLSELIIEFDALIDLIHVHGNFLEDYLGVDVVAAKERAEELFRKRTQRG